MDDNRIIELFLERNESAIEELQKKYAPMCFSISRNILHDESDVEECVNDTYLALWNSIPPERPSSLSAYLSRVIRNLSLKRLEYNSAKKRSSYDLVSLSELDEILPDRVDELSDGELGRLINDFLRTEKADSRNVFLRKYWFFDSIESIAKRYSFSEAKVKSMLFATRKRLKNYLMTKEVYL